MYTLGINAVYHDSAAVLIKDGVVIAAAEDERFTHIKHAKRALPFSTWLLPFDAIDYCLKTADITLADIDHVAYSYDPALLLKEARHAGHITLPLEPSKQPADTPNGSPWDPLFLSFIVNAPAQLVDGAPHHLEKRFRKPASGSFKFQWHYVEHHLSHEASAFLAAPYAESAVLTMDGRGERATTSYGVFDGKDYRRIKQIDLPDSLGLLYEEVTEYLGFLRSSDEYKVMALASYGKPAYLDQFREVLRYRGNGEYKVAKTDWVALFGPARQRGGPMAQHHYDIAHSLQRVLEDTVVEMCEWLHKQSGSDNLVMAGGVALNCVLNARVRDRSPFKNVWVQPAAGDAGTALGAALWIDFKQRGDGERRWHMDHPYLGPEYDDAEIEGFLKWSKLPYRRLDDVVATAADLLAAGNVIGWFQGRMEFGPRALGARSILASPVDPQMQAKLNDIKDREDFRPVAPVVMEEHASEWFKDCTVAPFMLFVYDVKDEAAQRIPAVRHVDGTARVQTVNARQHPRYYALLDAFKARTGVPVLVNTSFNTRGEPMVCSPRDAIESFWTSPLDALVIGNFLLDKRPAGAQA